jgi:hypothetical protein
MISNFFIIALRNLFKHKVFSFINIFGLAIGIGLAVSTQTLRAASANPSKSLRTE